MDASRQRVGGCKELFLVSPVLTRDPSKFDPLADLSQDAVGVVVVSGGQRALVDLAQMEASSLEGGEHLVHGRALCVQEDWLLHSGEGI